MLLGTKACVNQSFDGSYVCTKMAIDLSTQSNDTSSKINRYFKHQKQLNVILFMIVWRFVCVQMLHKILSSSLM